MIIWIKRVVYISINGDILLGERKQNYEVFRLRNIAWACSARDFSVSSAFSCTSWKIRKVPSRDSD